MVSVTEVIMRDVYEEGAEFTATLEPEVQHLFDFTTGSAKHGESPQFVEKTATDLEWSAVVEQLFRHQLTPEGGLIAEQLGPLPSSKLATIRLQQIAECMELLSTEDDLPLRGTQRIRESVAYAAREGVLSATDLEAISKTCDVASRTRRYLRHRNELSPSLYALASLVESQFDGKVVRGLDPCRELRETLQYAVEPGGRLSDDASPDLKRLRREVQMQTERIKARVEKLLRAYESEHLLQDDYFTIREDRYVLPLRVSAKRQVDGIIHGYSGSGQTAFVEPQELFELNNHLRWAQLEVEEEERRILQRLSHLVAENADALIHNAWVIGYLDFIRSAARLSTELDATVPEIHADLDLRRARHPLLFLKLKGRGETTIPNDIRLEGSQRVLIVSGPNTGGKTVLLKTLGMCALMTQAGLPIPVAEGSRMPFFGAIYTDIGDEQSIERDLSTFSGHLVNITSFLNECDTESLVMLDELFAGTDPQQGAALAVGLLEELARRRSRTFITTHLEDLKTLALQKDVFANASMGFDVQLMQPTFEMTLGVPGSSFALRIADRLGFPSSIVERARQVLDGEGTLRVDEVLTQLEDQATVLRKEQRHYEQLRKEAEQARIKYQTKFQELRGKERELLHEESRALKRQLDDARNALKNKMKLLRDDQTITRKDVDEAQRELQKLEKAVETVKDKTRAPTADASGYVRLEPGDVQIGQSVYVASFKRPGIILAPVTSHGEVQVQVGAIKLMAQLNDLYFPSESVRKGRASVPTAHTPDAAPISMILVQTSGNTLDLRGMRVDEAIERTDLFLDAMSMQGEVGAFIIHGHGTGALRRAIRDYLASSNYVREFRRGEREEGGDGVTLAYLREV